MAALIDTSVLLAFAFARDRNHTLAVQVLRRLPLADRLVPSPVLAELFYLTQARINYRRAIEVYAHARDAFIIHTLMRADMMRMQEIMERYTEAEFDFTDTAIMAMSERLTVQRVCTFDRRDFSIFRPAHCDYLELLAETLS